MATYVSGDPPKTSDRPATPPATKPASIFDFGLEPLPNVEEDKTPKTNAPKPINPVPGPETPKPVTPAGQTGRTVAPQNSRRPPFPPMAIYRTSSRPVTLTPTAY